MRTLVVYFSFSGNNRLLAKEIARRIGCDICPIVEKKRRTMLTIILDMLFRRLPRIEPLAYPPSNYQRIILVAPIWASKVANPMKTLIKREKAALSSYAFISLCGYEQSGQQQGIARELLALAGHPPITVAELKISDLFPPEKRNDIKTISRYRITDDDLSRFATRIDDFCRLIQKTQ